MHMKMQRGLDILVSDCDGAILIDWLNSKLDLPKEVTDIEGRKMLTYESFTATLSERLVDSIEVIVIPFFQEWPESVFLGRVVSKEPGI